MDKAAQVAKLLRYYSLLITSEAGSGHPTSCLSAADLMAVLFSNGLFKYDLKNPKNYTNDRLIFSKGHASALYYSLWKIAGGIIEKDIMQYRKFGSSLEGHPTPDFKFADVATGSLGQGLSVGAGFALASQLQGIDFKTFVLMGDGEIAEGSIWEALEFSSFYNLKNLIGIIDVNRLAQTGETMLGHDVYKIEKRISSFGWATEIIDGHNLDQIDKAYKRALESDIPFMIIAETIKGKGVSFLEDRNGYHGKALSSEDLQKALFEIGSVDKDLKIELTGRNQDEKKEDILIKKTEKIKYKKNELIGSRESYGKALIQILPKFENLIVLDGDVANSTFAQDFKEMYPERFIQSFIAEQNMVGVALGLSRLGYLPYVSTFSAFFTRAFDQIRMSSYSLGNIKFIGSHAGTSIGEDGSSQMGLEDIALFRSIFGSSVLYPADPVATAKLVEVAAKKDGIVYLRTTREKTPVIYTDSDEFKIGGSKTLRESSEDLVTVVGAGITLHEALKAYDLLFKKGFKIRVIDLYSIKPLDDKVLQKAGIETRAIIVVEDHYEAGGIGEAVKTSLQNLKVQTYSLAIRKLPRSGKPEELLDFEEISSKSIVSQVMKIIT